MCARSEKIVVLCGGFFEAVQDKLDQMVFIWNDIQALVEEREAKLLDVMDLAEKFWCDHCALIVTIKDTQDLLRDQEEPGVDPSVVKQQQESVEVRKTLRSLTHSLTDTFTHIFLFTDILPLLDCVCVLYSVSERKSMDCRKNLMLFRTLGPN